MTRHGSTPRLRADGAEPISRPIMVQRWADVTFLHWRYEPEAVQRLLPDEMTVETFDGSAWVALVPFRMEDLGLPGMPPVPGWGTFPEINVRTYVRHGPHRGVWFFSLDIDLLAPTLVARTAYGLPYCYGRAEHVQVGDLVVSAGQRRWPRSSTLDQGRRPEIELAVEIIDREAGPIEPEPLDRFLTDRWKLLTVSRRGTVRYGRVDHDPWPLYRGRLRHLEESLVAAAGLPDPSGEPHVMWAPSVGVRIDRPRRA